MPCPSHQVWVRFRTGVHDLVVSCFIEYIYSPFRGQWNVTYCFKKMVFPSRRLWGQMQWYNLQRYKILLSHREIFPESLSK
jgi:hypothetical protein